MVEIKIYEDGGIFYEDLNLRELKEIPGLFEKAKEEDPELIKMMEDNFKEYSCNLREPGFEELSNALVNMSRQDGRVNRAAGGKFLLVTCWEDGDEIIKQNPKMLLSASLKAAELVDIYDSEIKKK
ncbi:MAG: hypothetical protein GY861_05540 [bacterium]|nr:hypothetical protein [bacterium]